ncbi:MAG: ATP-binding protein [Armatimonadota bacterium]|nr:ATP-binding protein [Armatimonadota bacterium]
MILCSELSALTDGVYQLCDSPYDLPPQAPQVCDPVPLAPCTLASLRRRVREAARAFGMTLERCDDLTTAASEAAMNAVVHAGGGQARVGVTCTGVVQVWVTDSGHGIAREHLRDVALTPGYSTAGTLGEGFEMMQVVDRLWLLTGFRGTTVVLEQEAALSRP